MPTTNLAVIAPSAESLLLVLVVAALLAAVSGITFRRWWHGLVATTALAGLWLAYWFLAYGLPFGQEAVPFAVAFLFALHSILFGVKRLLLWSVQGWYRLVGLILIVSVVLTAAFGTVAYYLPQAVPQEAAELAREVVERLSSPCSPSSVREVAIPTLLIFADDEPLPQLVLTEVPSIYAELPVVTNDWEHFIGPYTSIRTAEADRYRTPEDVFSLSVTLTIVIDEYGSVLVAIPTGGPKEFYQQAVRIARRWKFEPFVRDGKPSVVRIEAIGVPIDVPEKRPARVDPFPTIENFDSLRIRMFHRIHGFGGQDYDLTIRGDGSVIYEGRWGVALTGRHCAVISREALLRLISIKDSLAVEAVEEVLRE